MSNVTQTLYTVINANKMKNHATEKDKGVHEKNQDSKNKKRNSTTYDANRTSKFFQKNTENTDDICYTMK